MKIGIIGAGGCFAQNFIRYLDSQHIESFGIGRSGPKLSPFWLLPRGYRFAEFHLVTQLPAVLAVLDTERPDVIVQFAAQGEGAASFGEHAPDFFQTNAVALVKLVLALNNRDYMERFVQIGSSEVYGSPGQPAKETDLLNPSSPYSVSKAAFDMYLQSMWRTVGFPMNIIRPSNCYTPGQQLYRIIPKAIICALTGQKLQLHGGGRAEKSYLHATDLSRAILLAVLNPAKGAIYNVGPDEAMTIRALVECVASACEVNFEELATEAPDRVGQDAKYHLDCAAIKRLGWRQEIALADGVMEMVDWVRKYPEVLKMETTYRHRA